MARLYKRKGSNQHYVKTAYNKGDHVLWTTYQIYPEAVRFLETKNIRDKDQIPNDLFYVLLENDLIYTSKSGPGISDLAPISEQASRSLALLKQASEEQDAEDNESELSASEIFYDESDIVEVEGFFRGRIPTEPLIRPVIRPIKENLSFTLPFEFFPRKASQSGLIYGSRDHDYKLRKSYWRFFELSGLATYSNDSEFNDVIGRFLEITRVIRSYAEIAYEESFEIYDEMPEYLLSMPIIREELAERFPKDEGSDQEYDEENDYLEEGTVRSLHLVYHLCKSVYDSVHQGINAYYEDRLGPNSPDIEEAMMIDLREHLTVGNDISAHYSRNKCFREMGCTYDEASAIDDYSNAGFRWGW